VPVTIEGRVTRRATLWVQLIDYTDRENPFTGFPLVLQPGATSASVPVTYQADDIFNPFPQLTQITLIGRTNAVTGDYDGSLLVEEDDPAPTLTVDAREATAAEGSALTWTFRLSEPMANAGFWSIPVVAPGGQLAELHSDDLPQSFYDDYGIIPPEPAVPLSELGLWFFIEIEPGDTETTLTIPIKDDGVSEPEEVVALILGGDDVIVHGTIELTGRVPSH
jgi:hypothetical protein